MTKANFIQIHTLHGYPGVLLNRDDAGLAKRLTYGGAVRTRISSQCLKRHWRVNDGPDAIGNLTNPELSLRSREIVTKCVIEPLENAGHDPEAIEAISEVFQTIVYASRATTSATGSRCCSERPRPSSSRTRPARSPTRTAATPPRRRRPPRRGLPRPSRT